MALPSTISTHGWPDHKNAIIGPYPKVSQLTQTAHVIGAPGELRFGYDASNQSVEQSFKAPATGLLTSIEVTITVGGSPADDVRMELYSHDAGGDTSDILLATAQTIPSVSVSTGNLVFFRFTFPTPVEVQSATTYWFRLLRTGALDTGNFYHARGTNANPYADGRARRLTGSGWTDITTTDLRFKVNVIQQGRYQIVVDKSANKVRCFKSTDHVTWTEQNASSAPTISSTSNTKSVSTQLFDNAILVFIPTSTVRLDVFRFNLSSDTWSTTQANTTTPTFNTNVAGTAPVMGTFRSIDFILNTVLSDYVFVNNGATESVMGSSRRRIKLSRRLVSDSTWNSTPYDVVGSASTPDATLPGLAVDYDLRAMCLDNFGSLQIFFTQSDTSNIKRRAFSSGNVFGTAIREMGSTPATTSNTAAYPMGQPVLFFRTPDWWMAFPYVDSGVLKVARCKTFDIESASLWTIDTVITAAIETTNSNPAVLVPDNENGGKLTLYYTTTDGKLWFTNDRGNNVWSDPQEFRPEGTKTLAALSAAMMIDGQGLAYLDTTPTPDEIRFDKVDIYFAKAEHGAGTYTAIKDFGIAEQVPYLVLIDVDELAATSYLASFYTRETENDSWGLMGSIGAEAADSVGVFSFTRSRYVKVEMEITGGEFPSSVIGY